MKLRVRDCIYLLVTVLLSALILFEGRMPSKESSGQSKIFSWFFDQGPKEAQVVPLEKLTLSGPSTLFLGEEGNYSASFEPENATDKRVNITFEGDALAENPNGSFLATKEGVSTIIATSKANPEIQASFSVMVKKEKIQTLSLAFEETTFQEGCTYLPTITSNVSDLKNRSVSYHFSDESVLKETIGSYVKAFNPGKCDIYVECDGIRSNVCSIVVERASFTPVTSFDIDVSNNFFVEENVSVKPSFNEDCSDKNYVLFLNEKIIENTDNLKINKPGEYMLKAQSISNPEQIVCRDLIVEECKAVRVTASEGSIQYGKTTKINYNLISEKDGVPVTYPEVTFSSSDPSIAKVDNNGNLVGFKKGSVLITVSWKRDPSIYYVSPISITSIDASLFDTINYWARKIVGHFSLFFVTGFFAFLFFDATCFRKKKRVLPLSCCAIHGAFLAILSEILQIGMQGRGPSYKDCLIDFSGYALAVLILLFLSWLYRRKHRNFYHLYLLTDGLFTNNSFKKPRRENPTTSASSTFVDKNGNKTTRMTRTEDVSSKKGK